MRTRISRLGLFAVLLTAALSISIFSSCKEKDENPTTPKPTPQLEFSEWKLTKFVDVQNQTSIAPNPTDEGCFFLRFELNKRIFIRSSSNNIFGDYIINPETSYFKFENLEGTEVGEVGDGYLFMEGINNTRAYSISDTILKLYYNNKQNYLEFEKRIPITN
jgi:hypothetical protein